MIFSGDLVSKKLGSYLKQKRVNAKLSQREVSETLGYSSPQFISNMERGLCSPPMFVLKKMMKLYAIPAKEITEFLIQIQREHLKSEFSSQGRSKSKVNAR